MTFADLTNQLDVQMQLFGVVEHIEGTTYTTKGKPFNKVSILDDAGQRAAVKIYQGNNPPLDQRHLTQRLEFNLKSYRAQNNRIYYSGFWQCPKAQQDQGPPTIGPPPGYDSDPPGYTAPPQAAGPPSVPQVAQIRMPDTYAYPVTPETQARMARSVAVEAACQIFADQTVVESSCILALAEDLAGWIETGNMPTRAVPTPQVDDGSDPIPGQVL